MLVISYKKQHYLIINIRIKRVLISDGPSYDKSNLPVERFSNGCSSDELQKVRLIGPLDQAILSIQIRLSYETVDKKDAPLDIHMRHLRYILKF